jgi:hypothetical protein
MGKEKSVKSENNEECRVKEVENPPKICFASGARNMLWRRPIAEGNIKCL